MPAICHGRSATLGPLADPEREPVPARAPDDDLRTVPPSAVNRILVVGGPLGLLLAIIASLWVSSRRVEHSALVQVERTWVPGEQLGIRTEAFDGAQKGVPQVAVDLALHTADGAVHPLGQLPSGTRDGLAQGRIQVPPVEPGPARLRMQFGAPGTEFHEDLPVELVAERTPVLGRYTVSGSVLQRADDTDPQTPMPVVLRPMGRLLSGFTNRFMVRVTHADGKPWAGPVEVVLVAGEFMGTRGRIEDPPSLLKGSTGSLGLLSFEGPMTSEVIRFGVRVLSPEDPERVLHQRRFRLVSYAGVTKVDVRPWAIEGEDRIELHARGLGRKRPVFVDVFGPDGAFVDALDPFRAEPPRDWIHPSLAPGLVQFEAYHFTTAPGESADVARVQLCGTDPKSAESLKPLVKLHGELADVDRVELDYDAELEKAYAKRLPKLVHSEADVERAREWLLGTLPVHVHGPPVALMTRAREEDNLAAWKRRWTLGLRWATLGGGAAFLGLLLGLMLRSHRRAAAATLREIRRIEDDSDGTEIPELRAHVDRAIRTGLLRGLGFVLMMALGLVLTVMLLENLLWDLP